MSESTLERRVSLAMTAAATSLMVIGCCCMDKKPKGSGGDSASKTSSNSGSDNGSDEPAKPRTPEVKVTASKILSDYKNNEVRADALYKGKFVQVTGVAHGVKKGLLGGINRVRFTH